MLRVPGNSAFVLYIFHVAAMRAKSMKCCNRGVYEGNSISRAANLFQAWLIGMKKLSGYLSAFCWYLEQGGSFFYRSRSEAVFVVVMTGCDPLFMVASSFVR